MKEATRLVYAYAVGRVRALERHLVSRHVFLEAAEAENIRSALKVVFDAGSFFQEWPDFKNSQELDDFLAEEKRLFLASLKDLFRDRDLFRFVAETPHPQQMLALVEGKGLPFVHDYVRHVVDLGNLKLFVRCRYAELPQETCQAKLMAGGFFDTDHLLKAYASPLSEMAEVFAASPYKKLWAKAMDTFSSEDTFIDLEKGIEDFLMLYLRKARYIVFGPEPLLAYGLAKCKELDMVRLLGVGILNQVPPSLLQKRMSETYV
jgi:V/A-type H+-transporting ATPase subunit C